MRRPPRIADSIWLGGPPDGQTSQLFELRLTLVGAAVLDDTAGDPVTVPLPALLGPCALAVPPVPPAPPPLEAPPPVRPLAPFEVADDPDPVVDDVADEVP